MSSVKSINQRIEIIMKQSNLNFRSMGAKLGFSDVVVGNIIKGRNKPSYDFLQKMLEAFTNLNAEWLMTGEGEITRHKSSLKNINAMLDIHQREIEYLKESVRELKDRFDSIAN